jgi:hypothetical protein
MLATGEPVDTPSHRSSQLPSLDTHANTPILADLAGFHMIPVENMHWPNCSTSARLPGRQQTAFGG